MSIVLLTGAASGIGRNLVRRLVASGHQVFATDLDGARLEAVGRQDAWPNGSVACGPLDVRDEVAWRTALAGCLERFGGCDVLLSVAGFLRPGYVQDTTAADVDLHFDVNVKGVAHGLRVVGGHFARVGRGHVVNFGSLASLAPVSGLTLYSASKYAVRGLSLAAAQDLEAHGVAVTLVMPDAVQTPMLDVQVDRPEAALTFSGGRVLTVDDIADVILGRVFSERPLEVAIPFDRGLLARISCAVPSSASLLRPILAKKGRAAQAARRKGG